MDETEQHFAADLPENANKADGASGELSPKKQVLSLLRDKIKHTPLLMSEDTLSGEEKEDGVRLESGNLVFDAETIDQRTTEATNDFIKRVEEGTWQTSSYAYWFELEGEDFVKHLAEVLKSRRGDQNALDLSGLEADMKGKLESAADSFRDRAKNNQVRKALERQLKHVPIDHFIGIDRNNGDAEVELRFNPNDLSDPSNDVDFIVVNGDAGPELLISSKRKGVTIGGIEFKSDPDQESEKTYGVNFNGKNIDENPQEVDFSHYDIDVSQGKANTSPFFTKIRVFTGAIDLQEEMRKFNDIEDEVDNTVQPYQPQAPAVSSSQPRWQRPTTYISSG